ncbi:hypothetical protein JCM9533A_29350 [Catenuloplanes niger JCM 9533]
MTSAGITAGIDMSLHLIARLDNVETARAVAGMLEHPWDPEVSHLPATDPADIRLARAAITPPRG